MEGWIKLHRKLQKWEWYRDSQMVHLFIHLLFNANYEPSKWRGIEVGRGQLITGRKILSKDTGISERSIRTCIERLKATNELTIKTTNRFSIITVCNYDSYQINDYSTGQHTDQPTANNRPATDQQPTTSKKEKKDKELKEFKEEVYSFKEKYSEDMLGDFILYWTEENKSGTKMKWQMQPTWSLPGRLSRWEKNNSKFKPESKNLYSGYKDSSFD